MQKLVQLRAQHLAQNHHSGNLNPAAGGAGTGAHHHQHHQNQPAQLGPEVKVRRTEARCRDDGGHGKKGVVQRIQRRGKQPQDVHRDDERTGCDDGKIHPHLSIAPGHGVLFHEEKEVNVEIHAEQHHEYGDDTLQIVAGVGPHGGVFNAEAAGTGSAEGGAQAVKQGHPPQAQQHNLGSRHGDVDTVENAGGLAHIGHHFGHGGAGAFRPQKVVGLAAHVHQRQHEHQNTHAAQPVGKATPEKYSIVQRLHIREDAGAGGGKAGNRLKHGVQVAGNLPGQRKGHRADEGDDNPRQSRKNESFPGVHIPPNWLEPGQHEAQDSRRRHGDEKADAGAFPVNQGNPQRKGQKRRFNQQDQAEQVA